TNSASATASTAGCIGGMHCLRCWRSCQRDSIKANRSGTGQRIIAIKQFNLLSGLTWRNNIYRHLILSLMLVMGLYSLCRIGFYLYNTPFFPDMTPGRSEERRVGKEGRSWWGPEHRRKQTRG